MNPRIDETELESWTRMRDQLIARRAELRAELASIEAALGPVAVTSRSKVRRPRRSNISNSKRVEDYLRQHPGVTARSVADALGLEINQANNALLNLLRREFVVRRREEGGPWHWSLAPGLPPAPAALINTELRGS